MMHEKESLGMGIVEFRKAEEAEETWEKLRNTKIEGSDITVTFCIPSKSAVVINNRIMWKFVRPCVFCACLSQEHFIHLLHLKIRS